MNNGGSSESCSWGDYNNDGYIDLYVTNYLNNEDNFLYKNNGNGTFTKITSGPQIQDNGSSYTCSWIDYNNDGRLDLFITNDWGENNSLYRNNGDETFTKITSGTIVTDGGKSLGCAWSDYDNDGDQDLFVANWNSENNFLYRNNGDGSFTKETSGPVVNDGKSSTGGSWGDFNNDGFMDLFVANDHYENNLLYVNTGNGSFNQITTGDIVNDGGKSVGGSWGDFDNDGLLDLYVVNIGAKNNLYRNNGDGTFSKITNGNIVNDINQSRGCTWVDYNNDGFLDMFVSNDLYENNNLYKNNGNTNNNWLKLKCLGTVSNKSAIGTKIQAKTIKNSNPIWQMREISGQTGYCSQNDLTVHFGLGNATTVDSLIIDWPSGIRQVLTNIPSNQLLTIVEQNSGILQLSMDTVNVLPNNSGFLTLSLNNPMRVSAMEFSLQSDVPELNLDSFSLSDRAGNMEFLYNPATRKIVIYSSSQSYIESGNGPIAKIHFSFDESGNLTDTTVVSFTNTLVAGTDNEPLNCNVFSGMILTIRKGDVNADGRIDVLDVQETARIIVGLPVTDYPDYQTKLYLADANPYPEGDGVVNIFDLNKIIQLSLTFGLDSTTGLVYKTTGAVDSMTVVLNNQSAISALQFDLKGVSVSSFRLQNLSQKIKAVNNGKRIVIYSPDGVIEPGQKIIGKIIYSSENGTMPRIQNPVAGTQTGSKMYSYSNGNTIYTKTSVNNPDDSDLPKSFELYQNYPNPFNPTTRLSYKVLYDGEVSLKIYNMLGQEIRTLVNGFQTAGEYQYQWNGLNNSGQSVGSGVYIYTLKAGKSVKSRKMIFLK